MPTYGVWFVYPELATFPDWAVKLAASKANKSLAALAVNATTTAIPLLTSAIPRV